MTMARVKMVAKLHGFQIDELDDSGHGGVGKHGGGIWISTPPGLVFGKIFDPSHTIFVRWGSQDVELVGAINGKPARRRMRERESALREVIREMKSRVVRRCEKADCYYCYNAAKRLQVRQPKPNYTEVKCPVCDTWTSLTGRTHTYGKEKLACKYVPRDVGLVFRHMAAVLNVPVPLLEMKAA